MHTFGRGSNRLQWGGQYSTRVSSQHGASDTCFELSLVELIAQTHAVNNAFQGATQRTGGGSQVVTIRSGDGFSTQGQELLGVGSGRHGGNASLLQLGAELVQCQGEAVALINIVEHAHCVLPCQELWKKKKNLQLKSFSTEKDTL